MHFDYTRKDPVFMDIETQSCVNLRAVGHRAYIRDRSTRLMSAVFLDGDRLITWVPYSKVEVDIPGEVYYQETCPDAVLALKDRAWVAHNAELFDAPAWEYFLGWSPAAWQDTIHTARQHGLPAGLDRIGQALFGRGKDKDGSAAMKLLSFCKARNGEPIYPVGTMPLWKEMLLYNIEDVMLLRDIYNKLPFAEPELLNRDYQINQRGVYVDTAFAMQLSKVWEEWKHESGREASERTRGELTEKDLASPSKVKAWLAKQGFAIESLARNTVESILEDPDGLLGDQDDPQAVLAVDVLRRRMDATRTSSAKIAGVLENADADHRLRSMFVYHKAGPGRWAGRGVQPHNLPRGLAGLHVERLRSVLTLSAIKEQTPHISDALSTMIRPIFTAPEGKRLIIADYAGIEARGVAWLAREEVALDVFRDPKQDIYCQFGGMLYGRTITKADKVERQACKVVVLGSGYGMGPNKLDATARNMKVDLHAAGVTPDQCVKTYRSTYARIPALWRAYQNAVMRAVRDRTPSVAGRCGFTMDGSTLIVELPSGRHLYYRNARVEKQVPKWGGPPVDTILYDSAIFKGKVLYGGLIAENITQATCRDILAFSLVALDDVVLHVHDEIVEEVGASEADERLVRMLKQMSTPPPWASDFPILVEGFVSPVYTKSAFHGYREAKAMNGQLLA